MDEELQAYVELNSVPVPTCGCWLWLLSLGSHGYGNASDGTKVVTAHRLSYRAFVGAIPRGALVTHSCDHKWCVAPHHLRLGTKRSNALEAVDRGLMQTKYSTELRQRAVTLVTAGQRQADVARQLGVSRHVVAHAVRRFA